MWNDEKEELRDELEQELQWVQYRISMLDFIEGKLFQMREMAERAKDNNLSQEEIEELNTNINDLKTQVNALDEESKKIENEETVD